MTFFELNYLDYTRTHRTGFAEFEVDPKGPEILGKEFPTCPFCGTKIGPLPWLPPHHIVVSAGTPGDLCTDGDALAFSRRFRALWIEAKLPGLHFYEQKVHTRFKGKRAVGVEIPEYFIGQPKFVLTRLNEVESGLVVRKRSGCDRCGVASRNGLARLRIDEATWGGDDVFSPSGLYGVVLVTERFVEFVKQNEFTNFHFTHQDDYREPKFAPR
jgi:hypothetical protein